VQELLSLRGGFYFYLMDTVARATRHTDFMFKLIDETLLHLEFQSDFTKDTLLRIFMYDARILCKYKRPVKTVIVYSGNSEKLENNFDMKGIKYEVEIIYIKRDYDGDEIYKKEIEKINAGKVPDWLNLIFLPIMKSTVKEADRAKAVIGLLKRVKLKKSHYEALVSAIMVLVDKFMDEKYFNDIWEELRMLKVIEFAEKKGIEKGMEKEKIKVANNMLKRGIPHEIIAEDTELSIAIIQQLEKELGN